MGDLLQQTRLLDPSADADGTDPALDVRQYRDKVSTTMMSVPFASANGSRETVCSKHVPWIHLLTQMVLTLNLQ